MKKWCMCLLFLLAACFTPGYEVPAIPGPEIEQETVDVPVVEERPIIEEPVVEEKVAEPLVPEPVVEVEPPVEENHIEKFLEDIPKKYWFWDIDENIAVSVIGNKRLTNGMIADLKTKKVYFYVGRMIIGSKYWRENKDDLKLIGRLPRSGGLPIYQVLDLESYAKGPVDLMKEYKNVKPARVETSKQLIKLAGRSFTSDLTLHFNHRTRPGRMILLRFDSRFNVPLIVEEYESHRTVSRKQFWFDVYWFDGFTNREITDDMVELPPGYLIMTTKEWREYSNTLGN